MGTYQRAKYQTLANRVQRQFKDCKVKRIEVWNNCLYCVLDQGRNTFLTKKGKGTDNWLKAPVGSVLKPSF